MRIEIEKKGKSCILPGRRQKKKGGERNNRQSDHHTSSRVTPCRRGYGDTFKEMIKGQVWPLCDITRIA